MLDRWTWLSQCPTPITIQAYKLGVGLRHTHAWLPRLSYLRRSIAHQGFWNHFCVATSDEVQRARVIFFHHLHIFFFQVQPNSRFFVLTFSSVVNQNQHHNIILNIFMKKLQANLEHVAVAVIIGEGVKGVIHFRQVGSTIQADDDYFGLAMQFQRLLKF